MTETDMVIWGSDREAARQGGLAGTEGEEITRRRPRRPIGAVLSFLFNVLHLLTHLVDDSLQRQPDGAQRCA